MFDKFVDYIWYLLPSALKRLKKKNQLFIFCKLAGDIFDDIKNDLFQLREETIIETCSNCMLDIAGQDRGMTQMKGESYEAYRKRLKMKALIAAMAGTEKGILYALESVGYDNCKIYPLYKDDTDKWAEININFYTTSVDDDNTIDFRCIVEEVMKTKQASTLPHFVFYYPTVIKNEENVDEARIIMIFTSYFYDGILHLDGTWNLDGAQFLGGESSTDTYLTNRCVNKNEETIEAIMTIENDLWYLDGRELLDGKRKIDAYIEEVTL